MLKQNYQKIISTDDYIIAEGEVPVCLVAHMDTVFAHPPIDIYHDPERNILWSPQGLGADDRAGIYAIIKIILEGYRPSIILTVDEELGGIGASKLVTHFSKCPFSVKPKMLIELDRQGVCDSVYYDCENKPFIKYINSFGFTTSYGTFTDISIIAPVWKIAAVNLSIGYNYEHSNSEILNYNIMDKTISKVVSIILDVKKNADVPYFAYIQKKKVQSSRAYCKFCGKPIIRSSIFRGVCQRCANELMKDF